MTIEKYATQGTIYLFQKVQSKQEIVAISLDAYQNKMTLDYAIRQMLESKKSMDKNEFCKLTTGCQRSVSITEK